MSKQDFENFLNQLQAPIPTIDKENTIRCWKKELNKLYDKVKLFLQPYRDAGKITVDDQAIQREEELLGKYEVKELSINIGSNRIKLFPVGTNIIGASGRVDMIGPHGEIKFILVDPNVTKPKVYSKVSDDNSSQIDITKEASNVDLEWKIATNPPNIEFFSLTEDSFLDALMKVTNG